MGGGGRGATGWTGLMGGETRMLNDGVKGGGLNWVEVGVAT